MCFMFQLMEVLNVQVLLYGMEINFRLQFLEMMQQQMMGQAPQRPGIGSALGGFGSSLIRGSLGLPPAQQMQQAPYQQGMYPPQ